MGREALRQRTPLNLGNNIGWTIIPRISQDFYWVGGTGNWDDPTHWSFSSGGPSSGCLPSALDDVFFDANSFTGPGQSTTINVENAYCRSMDWTGATNMPSLAGPMNHNLRLGGSLTFIPAMRNDFEGAWFFESNQAGNTITAATQPFRFDLTFAGASGEWILQDSIYVDWNIFFNSGTLRTNDQAVDCNRFLSEAPTQRNLVLGHSHIYTSARDLRSAIWDVVADNLSLDAGTSTIESRGAYSNLFRHEGQGNIRYHRVIFNALEGRLFSLLEAPSPDVSFDSLFFFQEGFVSGNNTVDYWYLSPGYRYDFVSDVTQTIGTLDANGNCSEGFIYIQTSTLGYTTNFELATDQSFERLYLHGIRQQGIGQLTANNSLDGGGNTNWTFNAGGGRTLYWVGDAGDWNDRASWSISSGGPGGECIPTPIDDVIFDANSFGSDGAQVSDMLNRGGYCRDLRWEGGITQTPRFLPQNIYVHGSLFIASNLEWFVGNTYLSGSGDHTVRTGNVRLRGVLVDGSGTYTLTDALQAELISHIRGTLVTNDQDVTLEHFSANSIENPKRLVLGNTYLTLTGANNSIFTPTFSIYSQGMIIEPGTSTIEFTHPDAGMRVDYALDFHNILFSEPAGRALLRCEAPNFNRIDLYGDGTVDGFFTTDSLFCAPGKTYILSAAETLRINAFWQIIGNNCTPVELRSDVLGTLAQVSMPADATIIADFIQMRDIEAVGGADFRAGARSTDIDNSNRGWLFENAPEYTDTGFLGPDVALCFGEPVTLDAFSFSANESYRWQDGSTNATFEASQTGTYSVVVTFENSCIIRDTIKVVSAQDFRVELPDAPELCLGETLALEADIGIPDATYRWQDGSTSSSLIVAAAGTYTIEVTIGGCLDSDSTTVVANAFPDIELGVDQTGCAGESYTLQSGGPAETYRWQDGSTASTFTLSTSGTYWLEAANGGCASRDSVTFTLVDLGTVSLGADTTICGDFQNFTLQGPGLLGVSYEWQDGSQADTLQPFAPGTYWLEVSVDNCSARDSIQIRQEMVPDFGLQDEYFPCAGDTLLITPSASFDAYQWSDGETDELLVATAAGTYYLDGTLGECVFRDFLEIIPTPIPTIAPLGPDLSPCEGETITLTATTDLGNLQWQDGSTMTTLATSSSGTYWYLADNQGCIASDTIRITFTPGPELDLGSDLQLCAGETALLSTDTAAEELRWQDGSSGSEFEVTATGIYWLEATANGCSSRDSVAVNYVETSSLTLGADTTLCGAENYTLVAELTGANFTWQDGTVGPTFVANTSGSYAVRAELVGCTTADTIVLTFAEVPDLGLAERYTLCDGEELTLTASTGADYYRWSTGTEEPTLTVGAAGNYSLTAVFGECTTEASFTVAEGISTPLDLGPDTTICEKQTLVLAPPISSGVLRWPDGSIQPTFSVTEPGLIIASLEANGCSSQDTIQIAVQRCQAFQAYFPNAFSPNLDGRNDDFRPYIAPSVLVLDYELAIFDRWGAQVFRTEEVSTAWDGRRNGELMPSGVYIYFLRIHYRDDLGENREVLSGDLLLLR
jgi:gliding motility-associated-like protein